ncbi:peptidoglycan DD-metalloendopeptidase family protein [Aliidongia dinghuensis]|nr:peptidoglycan DD-metalloendopeptidase family protein [Aliidongia dinghuensis]
MSVRHLGPGVLVMALLAGCHQSTTPAPIYNGGSGETRPLAPANAAPDAQPGSAQTGILETAGGRVTVQQGETLYAISRRSGVPVRFLIDANNLQPPYRVQSGQVLTLPRTRQHIVQQGETLYSVARRYGVEAASLARMNHIDPPYTIKLGQPLLLPPTVAEAPQVASALPLTSAPPSAPASALSPVEPASPPPPAGAPGGNGVMTTALSPPPSAPSSTAAPPAATQPPAPVAVPGPPQVLAPPATSSAAPPAAPQNTAAVPVPPPLPQRPGPAPTSAPAPTPTPAPTPAPAPEAAEEAPPPAGTTVSPPEPESGAATPPPRAAAPSAAVAAIVDGHRPPTAPLFSWPVSGRIISTFGPAAGGTHNDGINISAPEGTTVVAAEAGTIAYAGNELRGFGNLLLIKHDGGWVTAYAHNEVLLVKKGDRVRRGQAIARVGNTGGVNGSQLHFELRSGTKAVDPLDHLPQLTAGD